MEIWIKKTPIIRCDDWGLFYVPSFSSMSRYLVQCAFVWFYVPFSRSMCLRLVLWTVISFNVPSFYSMDCYLVQCSFVLFYGQLSFFWSSFCFVWGFVVICGLVLFFD